MAQLLVRGILRIVVRGWDPKYEGPVAIHASTEKPSKAAAAAWMKDREVSKRFAEQAWLDRDDLIALPYGAIIGVARLASVTLGRELDSRSAEHWAWTPSEDEAEIATRDAESRELRLTKRKKPLMKVTVPQEKYAWIFADPIEIEPVTGVNGQQRLWHLEGEIEGLVLERERRARKGKWRAPAISESRRDKALRQWRERWKTARQQLMEEAERNVRRRRAVLAIRLTPKAERELQEDVARYVAGHKVQFQPGGEQRVWVHSSMKPLFDGRDQVTPEEFEYGVRRRLKQQSDAHYAARRRERRHDAMLKIIIAAENSADAGKNTKAVLAKLEETLDRMLEEEEEDIEFARRELDPVGDERAMRAARRRAEQRREDERQRAEAIVQQEEWEKKLSRMAPDEIWSLIHAEEERLERVRAFGELRREIRRERRGM